MTTDDQTPTPPPSESYDEETIQRIMHELDIQPVETYVSAEEARRIITWRARHEYQEPEYEAKPSILWNMVRYGRLHPYKPRRPDGTVHRRMNLYDYRELFAVALVPRLGKSLQHHYRTRKD